MQSNPVINVIITAYNVGPYIAETIESVLAQTRQDYEAIVINDGSTDDTEERIEPYRDRIVYLKQKNGGVMRARNAGLEAARGEYIAMLDGDDLWEPRFLEILAGMLDEDSELGAAFPNAWFFGSPKFAGQLHQDVFPVAEPVTFDRVMRRECHIFGSLVFRRLLLADVGGYDESLQGQGAEDFELWLRMLRFGHRFKFTTEPLVQYRWRRNSLSNTGVGLMKCLASVHEKLLASYSLTPEQFAWVEAQLHEIRAQRDFALFKDALVQNDYKAAGKYLSAANQYFRRPKYTIARWLLPIAPGLVARVAAR
jgi:glycosyltransferase involved in cell wall biosynthesis